MMQRQEQFQQDAQQQMQKAQTDAMAPIYKKLDDAIKDLLSLSYELTAPKKRKPKSSAKNPGNSANGKENDRKGKQWLLTYTGSPKKMNKHYRERFHVDAVTAATVMIGGHYEQGSHVAFDSEYQPAHI